MSTVFIILYVLHFLNDGIRTTFISLLPFIARDLHLSFTQVGFLTASQGALTALLALPAGFFAMKIGGFKILFFALLFYSFGAFGIGFAPNVAILIVLF